MIDPRGRRIVAPWVATAALVAIAVGAALPVAAHASTTIPIRVSVKVILRGLSQTRPPVDDLNTPLTNAAITAMFQGANDSLLAPMWRGYRFVLTEIVDIGGCVSFPCDSSQPSFWYDQSFPTDDLKPLERWAKQSPAFLWRTNAVNVYINQGRLGGGIASYPPEEIVLCGSEVFHPANAYVWPGALLHHELGHFFTLGHVNGTLKTCCNPATCITDGDHIPDTLPDGECFRLDQLSTQRYGLPFASVGAVRQDSLLNAFWNNMAYLHPDQIDGTFGNGFGQTFLYRMTELQLDQWTDAANGVRSAVRAGRTRFVELQGACPSCPTPQGTSTDPYRTVTQALANAASGDIVLLRPGDYSGPALIQQPVTLRATRKGSVRILN